jgi:transmembrane sensor
VTNIVEFEARASIERQAREWLIRLDGDDPLTGTELERLREWMGRSTVHREELVRISRLWNQANVLTELAAHLKPGTGEPRRHPKRLGRPILAVASVALAFVVMGWWWPHSSDRAANGTYGTAIGQQQSISLPDASSIQLNTDSQVQVDYDGQLRRIRLLRGEALFSVTPDPLRPFEVHAGNSVVRAVGTAFSVHLESNKVDVTVTKGTVDVADSDAQPNTAGNNPRRDVTPHRLGRLRAGQTTTFGSGADHLDVLQLDEPELHRRMAWHDGYLVFSGEPLSEVVEQVNRYSPVTLEVDDPALSAVAVGGRFRIGDLDAILDALHTHFGIRSHQLTERNIRLEPEVPSPAH